MTVTLDFSHAAVTGQGFIALAALRVRKMELDRIRSVLRLRSKLSTATGPRFLLQRNTKRLMLIRLAFDDSRAGLIYRLILKENANRTIE
ncbi:hypothetical protein AB4672_06320 [Bacillus paralicheniformis]|uniref:hypothetical protein n=1 Tax=Bacillus paralicheniformis TaxID=1648923 RepID=UPI0034D272F5